MKDVFQLCKNCAKDDCRQDVPHTKQDYNPEFIQDLISIINQPHRTLKQDVFIS